MPAAIWLAWGAFTKRCSMKCSPMTSSQPRLQRRPVENASANNFSHSTRGLRALSLEDGAATLSELTAASVAQAIERSRIAKCPRFRQRRRRPQSHVDGTSGGTAASRTRRTLRCDGVAGGSEGGDGLRGARLRSIARAVPVTFRRPPARSVPSCSARSRRRTCESCSREWKTNARRLRRRRRGRQPNDRGTRSR